MSCTVGIQQQVTSTFHRMSRGMQNPNFHITHRKNLIVFSNDAIKRWRCRWSKDDGSACLLTQIQMTTHKIRVEVCLKNIFKHNAVLFHTIQIGLNLTQWINDNSFSSTLNIISALRQTTSINLLYFHSLLFSLMGLKGPYLCCSSENPSAYGPKG